MSRASSKLKILADRWGALGALLTALLLSSVLAQLQPDDTDDTEARLERSPAEPNLQTGDGQAPHPAADISRHAASLRALSSRPRPQVPTAATGGARCTHSYAAPQRHPLAGLAMRPQPHRRRTAAAVYLPLPRSNCSDPDADDPRAV